MAQAQLFGKGNKLHLGFVLVGFPCCLIELPGVGARSLHEQGTPNPSWCVAIPSLATSALQWQAQSPAGRCSPGVPALEGGLHHLLRAG